MSYLREFRINWRALAAASIGMSAGYSLVNYINNLFTPQLLDAFDWTRADIALVGVTAFLGVVTQPIAGRLTDAFGVRPVAAVGVVCAPLAFLGLSAMTGPFYQFFVLSFLQIIIVGGTTGAVVYARLIASDFTAARGVALAIAASAAPVAGAVCTPFLSALIEAQGWRAGYVALAGGTAIAGLIALCLVPKRRAEPAVNMDAPEPMKVGYGPIFRSRAFQLITGGIVLCNLAFVMLTAHLKVILLDKGVTSSTGSWLVSLFAFSVVVGRIVCGVALDRFPSYLVTAIALGLPAIGLGTLALDLSAIAVLTFAVMLLGLSLGAEGDILAYIVRDYFPMEIFSSVLGLVIGGLALSVSGGAMLLSWTVGMTETYTLFLGVSSIAAMIGCMLLFLLQREPLATE